MRKLLIFPLLFLVLPATAATKTNVEQLQSLLSELYQQKKPDEVVANRLKEIALTEQLTPAAVERLNQYQTGPLTAVQIRILATESALLPPPSSDLSSDPAPDRAAQTAMIGRMVDDR